MKCPGQDRRYWTPSSISEARCPKCEKPVEFFKDEPTRRCTGCNHKLVNPNMDFGCISYCRFASKCADQLPVVMNEAGDLMKDRVIANARRHFGTDHREIDRAARTADHAEKLAVETGGDVAIVLSAACLAGTVDPVTKDTTAASKIMEEAGADPDIIKEVTSILSGNSKDPESKTNRLIVHDARVLSDIEITRLSTSGEREEGSLEDRFLTEAARKRAEELLRR